MNGDSSLPQCSFQTSPSSLPITPRPTFLTSLLPIGTKNFGRWLENVDNMLRLFLILQIFFPEIALEPFAFHTHSPTAPGFLNKNSVNKLFARLRFHSESVLLQFCTSFQDQMTLCRRVSHHRLSYHVPQTQPHPACAPLHAITTQNEFSLSISP